MKLKWLLVPLLLLFILQGCKKDTHPPPPVVNNGGGGSNNNPPTTPVQNLTLNNVLQSNMVVQRNKPFTIWGLAGKGAAITVNASWNAGPLSVTADATTGKWSVTVPESGANSTPQTIQVTDGKTTVNLTNILIGDVWICAGQSNMVFQMDSIAPFRGVLNYQTEIAAANHPNIRAITLPPIYENSPTDSLAQAASWQVCSPGTVGPWSGVAYYFAQKLNSTLNVPVGIIVSAVDGTSCEAWTSRASFNATPSIAPYANINFATQLYNGMIYPFANLPVSGFIWYQGENNRYNNPPSDYTHLNMALISGWRNVFNQGQLPFYFVQMPPFAVDYFDTTPVGGNLLADDYAFFREAQAGVLTVPGTGMAVTMDVGEPANQHPRNKKPVGERLALLALKNTYNQSVQCYGPQYSSYSINGAQVTISYVPGTANGLGTIGNTALNQYFFIAGADHNFVQATATIQGSQVILSAPTGFNLPIMAVRYAFTNAPVTNLQNAAGLPAEPFRTDSWSN